MKVLVTGAYGFIGKHMTLLLEKEDYQVFYFDKDSNEEDLKKYIASADAIIHLAGINRPLTKEEFYDGNSNFTKHLVDLVKISKRQIPIIFSSSIQASLENDYGKSKKMAEDFLLESGLPVYVYRLANVFGKWCRPNYNSAAATFCYNIAHDLDIIINDVNHTVRYNFVEDICLEFLKVLQGDLNGSKEINYVNPTYPCTLGRLANLLRSFKKAVESDKHFPFIQSDFELKLFVTFLDYLSDDCTFNYSEDNRGYFHELYKSSKYGQISMNMSHPGITKGGHYHTYKNEVFYTVKGVCSIKLINIDTLQKQEVTVSKNIYSPVKINPYWSHEIKTVGKEDSYTLMWISEIYDEKTADTYKY